MMFSIETLAGCVTLDLTTNMLVVRSKVTPLVYSVCSAYALHTLYTCYAHAVHAHAVHMLTLSMCTACAYAMHTLYTCSAYAVPL